MTMSATMIEMTMTSADLDRLDVGWSIATGGGDWLTDEGDGEGEDVGPVPFLTYWLKKHQKMFKRWLLCRR